MYRVTKQIIFDTFDKINKRVIFEPDMELDYKRLWMNGKPYLQISCDDICTDSFIEGPDFPIEEHVRPIIKFYPENKVKEQSCTVQVETCEGKFNVNKFLKTIDGNNFIDIKPMQNNWYMVVYKELNND